MFGMGVGELLVILVVVLVVFGPGWLPEVMGSLGKGMQEFKKGLREPPGTDAPPENSTPPAEAKREGWPTRPTVRGGGPRETILDDATSSVDASTEEKIKRRRCMS